MVTRRNTRGAPNQATVVATNRQATVVATNPRATVVATNPQATVRATVPQARRSLASSSTQSTVSGNPVATTVDPPQNSILISNRRSGRSGAAYRISQELSEFHKEPPFGVTVEPSGDDLFHLKATIKGPPGTPYAGGIYQLDLRLPINYPFAPPEILFVNKIYHCNISETGRICLDTISSQWTPALTITKVLLSIIALLCEPNPDDPLEQNVARQYKNQRRVHDKVAKAWTMKYAK
ncbi:hypothetical protein KR009_005394 [Drosophila setifemur]|nr:hypothetical protein KR009_005394 [Drosophila setifemur]